MSSFSVRFFAPQVLPSTPSSRHKTCILAAPPVVPATSSEVDAARLEPRVEERDGYFVLREKFREGINPAEKIEIEKDPLKFSTEGGIEELAKMSFEELDKATKDDIDVRLKWLGFFHRRKHQ